MFSYPVAREHQRPHGAGTSGPQGLGPGKKCRTGREDIIDEQHCAPLQYSCRGRRKGPLHILRPSRCIETVLRLRRARAHQRALPFPAGRRQPIGKDELRLMLDDFQIFGFSFLFFNEIKFNWIVFFISMG